MFKDFSKSLKNSKKLDLKLPPTCKYYPEPEPELAV
jgi:hypothetical protein